jgi:citrate lyase subunit beta / citryl-CoA lyase
MRSLLFVPGDDPRKLAKGLGAGADVLLIDLEDSVALARKPDARKIAADFIADAKQQEQRPQLYVRVNAMATEMTGDDLDGVMTAAPDGIMLPKCGSGGDVQLMSSMIAVREAENDLPDGGTRIIAIATETAASIFHMGTYAGASRRLAGLTWGGEDLSADVGALANRLEDGSWTDPYRLARSLCLFGAAAAEVAAIDTVNTLFRNIEQLNKDATIARRDGFTAKMAIHPAQVPIINAVFTPSPEAVDRARRIVDLFRANPGLGVVGLDGEMFDMPHLRRAERILAQAGLR